MSIRDILNSGKAAQEGIAKLRAAQRDRGPGTVSHDVEHNIGTACPVAEIVGRKMAMQPICAIDASLTGTGLAISSDSLDNISVRLLSSKAKGASLRDRFERYDDLAERIAACCRGNDPCAILLENYSYGSQYTHQPIYEFGAMLRRKLLSIGCPVIEVPPSKLKQFTTGKGNAKKEVMAGFCAKRWGRCFHSNDECDAFCLCVMGLTAIGRIEGTVADRKFAADIAEQLV